MLKQLFIENPHKKRLPPIPLTRSANFFAGDSNDISEDDVANCADTLIVLTSPTIAYITDQNCILGPRQSLTLIL
jgi:hypothetical protein